MILLRFRHEIVTFLKSPAPLDIFFLKWYNKNAKSRMQNAKLKNVGDFSKERLWQKPLV